MNKALSEQMLAHIILFLDALLLHLDGVFLLHELEDEILLNADDLPLEQSGFFCLEGIVLVGLLESREGDQERIQDRGLERSDRKRTGLCVLAGVQRLEKTLAQALHPNGNPIIGLNANLHYYR